MIEFEFTLTEAPDGQLNGTGTMKEATAAAHVPITVTGTYGRPSLSLTFAGMIFDGREVSGAFTASYTSFGGVDGTLRLTGENYARSLFTLLQER